MGKTTIKATNTNYVIAEEKKTVLANNPALLAHYRKWADGTLDMDLIYTGTPSATGSGGSGISGLGNLLMLTLNTATYFNDISFVGSVVCNHSWTVGSGIGAPVGTIQNGNNFTLYCASNQNTTCTVLVKMTGWWK